MLIKLLTTPLTRRNNFRAKQKKVCGPGDVTLTLTLLLLRRRMPTKILAGCHDEKALEMFSGHSCTPIEKEM